MTLPFSFQNHVIPFAIQVGDVHLRTIHLEIWSPAVTWILTPPPRMKIGGVLAQWLAIQFIINMKVLPIGNIILVFYFDACSFLERHREVTVHRSVTAKPILFFGLDGRRKW